MPWIAAHFASGPLGGMDDISEFCTAVLGRSKSVLGTSETAPRQSSLHPQPASRTRISRDSFLRATGSRASTARTTGQSGPVSSRGHCTRLIERVISRDFIVNARGQSAIILTNLNMEETGSRTSRSGRVKSRKAAIRAGLQGTPGFHEKGRSPSLSSLCAMAAAEGAFWREAGRPDAPFCRCCRIRTSILVSYHRFCAARSCLIGLR
jgi:hypothetical protein